MHREANSSWLSVRGPGAVLDICAALCMELGNAAVSAVSGFVWLLEGNATATMRILAGIAKESLIMANLLDPASVYRDPSSSYPQRYQKSSAKDFFPFREGPWPHPRLPAHPLLLGLPQPGSPAALAPRRHQKYGKGKIRSRIRSLHYVAHTVVWAPNRPRTPRLSSSGSWL